jgi:hypothetical protein
MGSKVWAGVAAGVLAGATLLGVGLAAFDAGRDSDATTQVVSSDGDVVRVVDDGWHDRGPGPGFFFFLAFIALLAFFLFARSRRHDRPYWGRGPWGPGPWGPGPWGQGRGGWGRGGPWDGPQGYLDEWHRQAHAGGAPGEGGDPGGGPTTPSGWTADPGTPPPMPAA